ncbi:DUF2442 domain-containing protein [Aeromonas salmonicida]|uniref:DUF2442 domain-containing protein n=1 Tax=Aeromonas salmonicida TaxID=645 RepID=UPI000B3F9AF6|nr:DUF2442 domain-containing protein [Aeromonas salmonicida]ARW85362.1 integron cassette protein [Aeromonas salmonicida]
MKLGQLGISTSEVEVLDLTPHGVWVYAQGEEHFLPYEQFPWFRGAAVKAVFNVEPLGRDGLSWPDLDVDLLMDSIRHPENYPLVARH